MSKKIKYRPNIHQPSLFDSQTSPFRIPGLEPETPEAHPSIRDFVVEVKKRQQASSGTASNMEIDTASLRPAAALSLRKRQQRQLRLHRRLRGRHSD